MKLTALKRHPYAGKTQCPGDTYEATDAHAKVLIFTRKAEAAKPKGKKKGEYARKDMQAEAE